MRKLTLFFFFFFFLFFLFQFIIIILIIFWVKYFLLEGFRKVTKILGLSIFFFLGFFLHRFEGKGERTYKSLPLLFVVVYLPYLSVVFAPLGVEFLK